MPDEGYLPTLENEFDAGEGSFAAAIPPISATI